MVKFPFLAGLVLKSTNYRSKKEQNRLSLKTPSVTFWKSMYQGRHNSNNKLALGWMMAPLSVFRVTFVVGTKLLSINMSHHSANCNQPR